MSAQVIACQAIFTPVYDPDKATPIIFKFYNSSVYEIQERDNELIFIGELDVPVYLSIGTQTFHVFTNGTIEVGSMLLRERMITLTAGAATTISETPIVIGTAAVSVGASNILPLNVAAIPSVSSIMSANRAASEMVISTKSVNPTRASPSPTDLTRSTATTAQAPTTSRDVSTKPSKVSEPAPTKIFGASTRSPHDDAPCHIKLIHLYGEHVVLGRRS
ncbi:hypothetical protein EJ08DRAFT_357272 [Tothia fuscella]|uniref:Uncharacterized protein n=1 Tax=Tothia fuscella TaxID=1048955 RepID=A0A9P4NMK7_9PEZI|nr:hypothetical protein EJ08DRAFT_357272 [Tothia fuscella]